MIMLILALIIQQSVRLDTHQIVTGPQGLNTRPDDPIFSINFKSGHWQPYCPAGTDMIRMDVTPHCYWGNAEMVHKPSLDQFKCVKHKWYKAKPKKCGVDQYFNVGIGVQ